MASSNEKDDVPMLPISDSSSSSRTIVSLVNTSSSIAGFHNSTVCLGHTPPLVQMSGPRSSNRSPEPLFLPPPTGGISDSVGVSTSQPDNRQAAQIPTSRDLVDSTNPHQKSGLSWSKFFAVSCVLPIFVDPLFALFVKVDKKDKCLLIDWPVAKAYVVVRTITDVLFIVNIMIEFRLAYVYVASGAGQLVRNPIKKIANLYLRRRFWQDFIILLPLTQILILISQAHLGASGANYAKKLLQVAVLFQYIPKLCRIISLLSDKTPTGLIFESGWANFVFNLLAVMLTGHFVGSCWYLMGLQRVNQCLRNACNQSINKDVECKKLIDCDHRIAVVSEIIEIVGLPAWKNNVNASACFQEDGFHYGIYSNAVNLTTDSNPLTRYTYSLFWGFQQISTLAGNQVPSYYLWEILFTMMIIVFGLLIFALLIGNMHNFLQGLGRRNLETLLRRRDVEQWMSHKGLPESIRKRVQEAERFNWAATKGVNEEMLFENMPDDIQRDIRRHLFKFLDKVSILSGMDELVLDAIRGRLKQKIYINNSMVLYSGGLLDKMVFIVRGKMESIGEDDYVCHLSDGDVCGEELLTWCIERSSVNSDETVKRLPSKGLLSNKTVWCVTHVEAFSLSVADLEDVMNLFSRFLRSHRVQRAGSSGLEIPKETAS